MSKIFCEIAAKSGGWLKLAKGDLLKITDLDGEQVADMFAVSASDMTETLSVGVTRASLYKMFPEVNDSFRSTKYAAMLTFIEDNTPGIHDMLYTACSQDMYKAMGCTEYHPNCSDNFRKAALEFDWNPPIVPDPVNLFQNTKIVDGKMTPLPAATKSGDFVVFRAEMDLYVVVTACSMDLEPINGKQCSRIKIEIV